MRIGSIQAAREWGIRNAFRVAPDIAEFLSEEIGKSMIQDAKQIQEYMERPSIPQNHSVTKARRQTILAAIETDFKSTRQLSEELGWACTETHDYLRRMFTAGLVDKYLNQNLAYWRKKDV